MSTYTVKYNRTANHIAGINARTQGTGNDTGKGHVSYFAETTCGALTRGRFADGAQSDDIAEILKAAELNARINNRKMCSNCSKAAQELIDQQ